MTSRSHTDDNNIRVDYKQDKVEEFLGEFLYKQVKKITWISVWSSERLFHVLDHYTSNKVADLNSIQWRIPCLKRKDVRAILLQKNGKFLTWKNDKLIIGTNSIEKTEKNDWWAVCPRVIQQIDSTQDKLLCAVSCNHTGCAEKNLMNMATSFWVNLFGSKIILFGHTGGPCASCCETLAEKWIKAVIIWSAPESKSHKDYDKQFAKTWYKVFTTPEHLLRRLTK